jgi:hypothetical protein
MARGQVVHPLAGNAVGPVAPRASDASQPGTGGVPPAVRASCSPRSTGASSNADHGPDRMREAGSVGTLPPAVAQSSRRRSAGSLQPHHAGRAPD